MSTQDRLARAVAVLSEMAGRGRVARGGFESCVTCPRGDENPQELFAVAMALADELATFWMATPLEVLLLPEAPALATCLDCSVGVLHTLVRLARSPIEALWTGKGGECPCLKILPNQARAMAQTPPQHPAALPCVGHTLGLVLERPALCAACLGVRRKLNEKSS